MAFETLESRGRGGGGGGIDTLILIRSPLRCNRKKNQYQRLICRKLSAFNFATIIE